MKVFSGSANEELGKEIALKLHSQLSQREIFIFPDGEKRIQLQEKVVDEHVVIVQPTSPPADSNYLELFFLSDAAHRSGAKSVTVVIPYLGYQRQDHVFRDGESVSLEVMVKTMEAVGIDRVITMDLHSIRIPEVFTVPITHLTALPLFKDVVQKNGWLTDTTSIVSPDVGGERRVKMLSEMLGSMPYTSMAKKRNRNTGKIQSMDLKGIATKRMLIIDDMISSGGTIVQAARILKEKGAKEIYVFATHAIFSKDAPRILQNSDIDKVFITDSVFISKEKRFKKLEIISIADMIARELKHKS